ncbi:hypothetical protein Tco_0788512 [Tanacetum coccineum]
MLMISYIPKNREGQNHKRFPENTLFACVLSQQEPNRNIPSPLMMKAGVASTARRAATVFKIQKVWTSSLHTYGKKAIGTKVGWFFGLCINFMTLPCVPDRCQKCLSLGGESPIWAYTKTLELVFETLLPICWTMDSTEQRKQIDRTLFIKRAKVIVYWYQVQTSSMGELTSSLVLQVNQKEDGILLSPRQVMVNLEEILFSKYKDKDQYSYGNQQALTKTKEVRTLISIQTGLELQGYLINDGYADLVRMMVTLLILLMFHMIGLHHITNGHQFTMSNRQERIGYSKENDNW